MSDIKIFVTHTPNRNTMRLSDNPLLYNVIAGSDFQTEEIPEGVYLDNQGDNISSRNKSYCELTTQYWAWKNMKADYYGFCHYRRFFSFSRKEIGQSCWGTIEYDFLDECAMKEMRFNETDMRNYIEKYDFLIAKGIKAEQMLSNSIYNHWEIQPELHIKDVDLLLDIIWEKYHDMYDTAKEFFAGDIFYPCNMFIMKKGIFDAYSEFLFDILEEFCRRADIDNYSREGYRTPAELAERIAGIYYLYLKKQSRYKMGELQIALIHNADGQQPVQMVNQEAVTVVLAANQKYVPVLYTCIQSITDWTKKERSYQIYIFHTDINEECRENIRTHLEQKHIRIRFVNVKQYVAGYLLQAKEHITTETFYRFLILDILRDLKKVIYLDSDMIICRDIAELYDIELENNLIAAVKDPDIAGQCNMKNAQMREYCKKILHLKDPFNYFQAGVLVLNIQQLNKVTSVRKLFELSDTGIYRYSDQDILNIICQDRVLYLDMNWNVLVDCEHRRRKEVIKYAPHDILDSYEAARKDPYIIHYAGWLKPWMKPDEDFADRFWEIARKTMYYEQLLYSVQEYTWMGFRDSCQVVPEAVNHVQTEHRFAEALRKVARHFFPKNTKIRAWAIRVYCKMTGS